MNYNYQVASRSIFDRGGNEIEGYKGKFNFNETCRAMSSRHNLRMGALRLSEYLKIMNESDDKVKMIVNKKYNELRAKQILV